MSESRVEPGRAASFLNRSTEISEHKRPCGARLGSCRGVAEVFVPLKLLCVVVFRDNKLIYRSKTGRTLCRNVGNQLPTYAAQRPTTAKASPTYFLYTSM
jgi:hypothetical protein